MKKNYRLSWFGNGYSFAYNTTLRSLHFKRGCRLIRLIVLICLIGIFLISNKTQASPSNIHTFSLIYDYKTPGNPFFPGEWLYIDEGTFRWTADFCNIGLDINKHQILSTIINITLIDDRVYIHGLEGSDNLMQDGYEYARIQIDDYVFFTPEISDEQTYLYNIANQVVQDDGMLDMSLSFSYAHVGEQFNYDFFFDRAEIIVTASEVPIPSSILMLITGLSLFALARKICGESFWGAL